MLACQTTIAIGACLTDLPFGDGDVQTHLNSAPREADSSSGHEDCPAQKSAQATWQLSFAQLAQAVATAPPVELDWSDAFSAPAGVTTIDFRAARAGPTPLAILHCCLRN